MVRPFDDRIYPSIEAPAEQGIAPDLFPIENAVIVDKRKNPTRIHKPDRPPKPEKSKS